MYLELQDDVLQVLHHLNVLFQLLVFQCLQHFLKIDCTSTEKKRLGSVHVTENCDYTWTNSFQCLFWKLCESCSDAPLAWWVFRLTLHVAAVVPSWFVVSRLLVLSTKWSNNMMNDSELQCDANSCFLLFFCVQMNRLIDQCMLLWLSSP